MQRIKATQKWLQASHPKWLSLSQKWLDIDSKIGSRVTFASTVCITLGSPMPPQIQASFLHPSPYPPLWEGGHNSGDLFFFSWLYFGPWSPTRSARVTLEALSGHFNSCQWRSLCSSVSAHIPKFLYGTHRQIRFQMSPSLTFFSLVCKMKGKENHKQNCYFRMQLFACSRKLPAYNRAFWLTIVFGSFLLTIRAFSLTIVFGSVFCLQLELFCLHWGSVSKKAPQRTVSKKSSTVSKKPQL